MEQNEVGLGAAITVSFRDANGDPLPLRGAADARRCAREGGREANMCP